MPANFNRILNLTAMLVLSSSCSDLTLDAPDWILHSGKIVTVDSGFSIQESLAIRDEFLVAVGSNDTILKLAGPNTRLLNLAGKTVIPGLIDNHHHLLSKAVDQYLGVEVALVESLPEMLDGIRDKAQGTPAGQVIYTTSGWLPQQLPEKRGPSRKELDEAAPENPVIVQGGHTYYLNSLALAKVGIDNSTPSPEGGLIVKDDSGEPTGLLVDNAMGMARHLIPRASHADRVAALEVAQRKQNSVGVTSIREPGLTPEEMRAYQALWRQKKLTLRASLNLHLDHRLPTQELTAQLEGWGVGTGFGDPFLRLDGIGEFGIDGGFEAAMMSEPYLHLAGKPAPADYRGLERIDPQKFTAVLSAANRLGWRGSIHAVGDRGIDLLLDAYETVDAQDSIADKRWILEHAHYTRPDQFQRIRDLGVLISTQFHPYMSADTMIEHWGPERASQTMRMRDWLDAGLQVGGGSDWSLVPANPFWMIYFWVTRHTRLWDPIGEAQAISREEALQVMTINNAYLTFEEEIKGSLEPGKLADLVILDKDLLTVPEEEILEIEPLATFLGGQPVYQAEGFELP